MNVWGEALLHEKRRRSVRCGHKVMRAPRCRPACCGVPCQLNNLATCTWWRRASASASLAFCERVCGRWCAVLWVGNACGLARRRPARRDGAQDGTGGQGRRSTTPVADHPISLSVLPGARAICCVLQQTSALLAVVPKSQGRVRFHHPLSSLRIPFEYNRLCTCRGAEA